MKVDAADAGSVDRVNIGGIDFSKHRMSLKAIGKAGQPLSN